MDNQTELQRIRDAVAGEGSDRVFTRKIVVAVAAVSASAISVAFLSFLAIKIGAVPLIVIIFGVLALMAYDLFDTLRDLMKPNGNDNAKADG